MFAAIGIGISVNFAIHALHRTIELVHDYGEDLGAGLAKLFPVTGRALLFNFAAVFFGFAVLGSSQITALREFGLLVATVTLTSFIASVTLLPAMLLVFRPRFLQRPPARKTANGSNDSRHGQHP
jgi:predicted RND superfamily exporter protein